jgi:hypothetical protein
MTKINPFSRIFFLQCVLLSLLIGGAVWGSIRNSDYYFMLWGLPIYTMFFTSAYMNYYLGKHGLVKASEIRFVIDFKSASLYLSETKRTGLKYFYHAFISSFLVGIALVAYLFLTH